MEDKSDTLKKAIHSAAYYIYRHQKENGKFIYKTHVNVEQDKFNSKKYNCLRHAGTLYALELYEKYYSIEHKNKRFIGNNYFIEKYIKQIDSTRWAVVSRKKEEGCNHTAKLGATGIGLIALCNMNFSTDRDFEFLPGMGNFILSMQKKDGSFYSKFNIKTKKPSNKFNSLYYPGEAALGLLYLYEITKEKKYMEGALRGLLYTAIKIQSKNKITFDHWSLLAIDKLFKIGGHDLDSDGVYMLQEFAGLMIKWTVENQVITNTGFYTGSFKNNIRACSIGTIVEGLCAAYYITASTQLKNLATNSINLAVNFLISTQLTEFRTNGGFPTSADWPIKTNKSAGTIRIDNVQHCLSALIMASQILRERR